MLKFLVTIVLILMISGVLLWKQKVLEQETLIIREINQNMGLTFKSSYSLKTNGFPNRIDTELKGIRFLTRDGKYTFDLNRLLLMSLIYKSDHNIISIDPPIIISNIENGFLSITKGSLKISISRDKVVKNRPSLIFHGKDLILNINRKKSLRIKDLIIATRNRGEQLSTFQELSIKAHGVFVEGLTTQTKVSNNRFSLNFDLSATKIDELKMTNVPFLKKLVSEDNPLKKVTLEIIDTDIESEEKLYDLFFRLVKIIDL